jgi:TolA-binding protein
MKKLLITMTMISGLAAAAPAAAQYAQANAGMGISNRISQLETRLQAGIQAGVVDRYEAQSLRQQLRDLNRLERQYSRNGLTVQERQDLQMRIRAARQQLRTADGGRYDRDMRYGNWQNDDYYGQGSVYGQTGTSGQGAYGQGAYGQGGYYGQGGPYESVPVCERRGGIAGVIGSVLGTNNDCGLQVGQRVSGGLYGVPYEYQNMYRDGYGTYHRSDGRNIYQIDARTNTVVRVYPMNR